MTIRSILLPTVLLITAVASRGAVVVTPPIAVTAEELPALPIPDADLNGLTRQLTIQSSARIITSVEVDLVTSGGWVGDLYAYLSYSGGISILVNRVGRTSADGATSGASGLDVTFTVLQTPDIHGVAAGTGTTVSGFFGPDGRNVHPDLVVESDPRSAMLDGFQGLDPNGTWTLFIADVAGGDVSTLDRWSLTVTGVIPEPASWILAVLGAGLAVLRRRRDC